MERWKQEKRYTQVDPQTNDMVHINFSFSFVDKDRYRFEHV